jgi:glycosyltransferase involved in cell wall biosynthesis
MIKPMTPPTITFVIPCYNEDEVLPVTIQILDDYARELAKKGLIHERFTMLLVDDGSTDRTWHVIKSLANTYGCCIKGIKLSRNFGHQAALISGLHSVTTDVAISIDADLQDDISVVEHMVQSFISGNEIVYGVRKSREVDSFFKKFTALAYYRLLKFFGVNIVYNHADFRLMSRKALSVLDDFRETNLFLRGIVPLIGFKTAAVEYGRKARTIGTTKYSLSKMLRLAFDGITAFSSVPLKMISWTGAIISLISIVIGLWAIYLKIFSEKIVPGWASTVVPMYFLGGVQLFSLGVIGIYLSRIYDEVKKRPRYVVEEEYEHDVKA